MSDPLLVTEDVAGRTGRRELVIRPGDAAEGLVVVASARNLQAWDQGALGRAILLVIGDGPLPDGLHPFLHLPDGAAGAVLQDAIDAALEVAHLRRRLDDLQRDAALAHERQLDLARVGIALTAERDLGRLLQLILTTARELMSADAGSLYLIEESDGHRMLRFVLAQNDSVPASLTTATMPIDPTSLAGYVALTGEPVTVEDVWHLPSELPYHFNPAFDLATGYHTRSLLTAPIATRAGEVVGVLQLINRKAQTQARIVDAATADAVVRPFGQAEVAVIRALAAQAAVAIENTRLVQEIERLFEGFVRASVTAIEQRDPSTSGHSLRVAHYTVAMAEAIERNPPKSYADVRFSRDDMTQLRYAALLHDFGKVGVREAVLTKGKKLFAERFALVQERFRHAHRAHEVVLLRRVIENLRRLKRVPTEDDIAAIDASLRQTQEELGNLLASVIAANEPTVLESSTAATVSSLARQTFPGDGGQPTPLLLPEELRALMVPKGSLDEEERREIESHVVHSYQFLLTIPWPRRYQQVPIIAYGHHEKLNGRGYPNRIMGAEIPTEVRIMTISDIYDALAAGDRPYKRSVSSERALAILEDEAKQGFVDRELVDLFIRARVFAKPIADPSAL